MSEDPEFLNLSAMLRRLKERMSPEVKQALLTIMDAVLDGKGEDLTARSKHWAREGEEHIRRTKERIERAERGVRTRRENQKKKAKKSGVVKKQRPVKARTKKARKHASAEAHARYLKRRYGDPRLDRPASNWSPATREALGYKPKKKKAKSK